MRTPEEIKKGLECCTAPMLAHDDCPYKADRNPFDVICKDRVMEDALALIQQLEAKLAELEKRCDAEQENASAAIRECAEIKLRCMEQVKVFADRVAVYEKPLALDDVLKLDDIGNAWWVEYKGGGLAPTIMTNDCHQYGEQILNGYVFKMYDYGKTWRCWPQKPTDEERKAAKWDD